MNVRALIEDGRVHVMDGAMGTQLYDRGVFVNVCYDELNLTQPELVETIHREYREAGAELLTTNTFGANPVKLSGFGLDQQTEAINEAAVEIAKRASQGLAAVLGALGPLGIRIEPWGPTSSAEAEAFFGRQARGLMEGGADGFVLETFSDLTELHAGLRAVRSVSDLPVFAQVTVEEGGSTSYGTTAETVARLLDEWGADVIGVNCSVGPAETLDAVERMARVTRRPLVAQPNAGLPRAVGNRKMYLASPAYMARYAVKIVEAGTRFVGGCCGTTPDHIREIAAAVRGKVALGGGKGSAPPAGGQARVIHPSPGSVSSSRREPTALGARSLLGRKLAKGEFVISQELLPPTGWNPSPLFDEARRAVEAGADVVSVAELSRGPRRMGTIPSAILVGREIAQEVIVRYNCRDRSMSRMISDFLGMAAAGIRNVIIATGDPAPFGPYPDPTAVLDLDSIGLANVLARLNRGEDPGGGEVDPATSFVVGVELDPGPIDLRAEARRFRWKVDAGADFAVTRPVFDDVALVELLDQVAGGGREIPIVASVYPLTSLREAEYLAQEVPGVRVPDSVLTRMDAADKLGIAAAREVGVQIAVEVVQALRARIAGVQVFPTTDGHGSAFRLLGELRGAFGDRSGGQ